MYRDGERILAWIAKIDSVEKHPNADALDICTVGGWKCVTKVNEFKAGDLAVYISIDSWVPHKLASFLSKGREPREYNGIKGERLRTITLRGQISQGLLLPVQTVPEKEYPPYITGGYLEDGIGYMLFVREGDDVTKDLHIQKWEAPIPASLTGQVEGPFPLFIPKTDQERVQNLVEDLELHRNEEFEVTQKLDGSSMTVFFKSGDPVHAGVCSRNFELKINEENKNNSFVKLACESNLIDALTAMRKEIAIQGELMGPGIQSNDEKLQHTVMYVFDMYDIAENRYFREDERKRIMQMLYLNGCNHERVIHCPVIEKRVKLDDIVLSDLTAVSDLLRMAEGFSAINKSAQREGLVFKSQDSDFSFKCISNKWLLNKDD